MNPRYFFPLLLLFVTLLFPRCTIEKRLYTKGWSVEFHRKHQPVRTEEKKYAVRFATSSEENVPAVETQDTPTAEQENVLTETTSAERSEVMPPPVLTKTEQRVSGKEVDDTIPGRTVVATEKLVDPTTADRKENAILIGVGVMMLAIIGLVIVLAAINGGSALTALGALLLVLVLMVFAIFAVILLAYNSTRDVVEPEDPEAPVKKPRKERTAEEQALLKRKGLIFVAAIFAAFAGILYVATR